MPTLPDGLRYARAGMAIIPVFTVDASGRCQCGSEHKRDPKSIGKHPATANGVSDATRRGTTIEGWFRIQYNIGIACGMVSRGLAVVDIDDREVAKAIVDYFAAHPEVERPPISSTTRGIHLWFICPGEVNRKLRRSTGTHLGEIRCDGQYVIGPPSATVANGAPRRFWRTDPDLIPEPMGVESVLDWLIALLSVIGVALAPIKDKAKLEDMPGDIEELELPFKPRKTVLKNIISGKYPTDDRSGVIFRLIRELKEQAERDGYDLSTAQLAGIAKKIDRAHYHKYDGTFDGRTDGDLRYWEVASNGGQPEDATGAPQAATGVAAGTDRDYAWSDVDGKGRLVFDDGSKRGKLVANFRPVLIRETTVILGEDASETEFTLRCTLPDDSSAEIILTGEDYSNVRALRAAFAKQLNQRQFIIYPDMTEHVWIAARQLASNVSNQTLYAETGFHQTPSGPAFIFPNGSTMTATGISPVIFGRPFAKDRLRAYLHYGEGVRHAEDEDDWSLVRTTFTELLTMASPRILVPLLLTIFGAPLNSVGVATDPPLLHLHGESNAHKTSVVLTALSLYGKFPSGSYAGGRRVVLESWSSSINSLEDALHQLRDLVVLVDDFKPEMVKDNEVTRLVQNYGDRTSRSRMGRAGVRQRAHDPQAFWVNTGQDQWEREKSTATRTLSVLVKHGDEPDIPLSTLDPVQSRVMAGDLALVGGTYVRYLAEHYDRIIENLGTWRAEERRALLVVAEDRVLSTVTGIRLMGRIVRDWLEHELPDLVATFDAWFTGGWADFRLELAAAGLATSDLVPIRQILHAMHEHLAGGRAYLIARGGLGRPSAIDAVRAATGGHAIGYRDEEYLYLSQSLTFDGWYLPLLRQAGTPAAFTWRAVKRSGHETVDADDVQLREFGSIKVMRIPWAKTGIPATNPLSVSATADDTQDFA